MTTYVSEETLKPVVIECRFCRKFDEKHVPAVAVAGQWQGGDNDVDPHWVPVCAEHLARWHDEEHWDGGVVPVQHRLPVLPLAPSGQERVVTT